MRITSRETGKKVGMVVLCDDGESLGGDERETHIHKMVLINGV